MEYKQTNTEEQKEIVIEKLKHKAYEYYKTHGNLNNFYYNINSNIGKTKISSWEYEFWNREKNKKGKEEESHTANTSINHIIKKAFLNKTPSKILYEKKESNNTYIKTKESNNIYNDSLLISNKRKTNKSNQNSIDFDIDLIEYNSINEYYSEVEKIIESKGKLLIEEGEDKLSNNEFKLLLNCIRLKKKLIEANPYYDMFVSDIDYIYMSKLGNFNKTHSENDLNCNYNDSNIDNKSEVSSFLNDLLMISKTEDV